MEINISDLKDKSLTEYIEKIAIDNYIDIHKSELYLDDRYNYISKLYQYLQNNIAELENNHILEDSISYVSKNYPLMDLSKDQYITYHLRIINKAFTDYLIEKYNINILPEFSNNMEFSPHNGKCIFYKFFGFYFDNIGEGIHGSYKGREMYNIKILFSFYNLDETINHMLSPKNFANALLDEILEFQKFYREKDNLIKICKECIEKEIEKLKENTLFLFDNLTLFN